MENNAPSKLTSPIWDSTSTGPRLWIFFYIISFFYTLPSMSHKLLLHPTQSLSRANSPYNFSTAKLPLLIMTQAGQLLHITDTFNLTLKAHVHLQNWIQDAVTKTGTLLFVGAQMMPVNLCKGQTEKDRERETTLETKINNIWTNYITVHCGWPPHVIQNTAPTWTDTVDSQC